jgi:imidazolonepropionase-like amidohydrolase
MKTMAICLALLCTVHASANGAQTTTNTDNSDVTYLHAGTLLDVPGQPPKGKSTVVIRAGKIVDVLEGFVAPKDGAKLLDLSDLFVMPGLIDMHVHLGGIGGDPMLDRLTFTERDDADNLMYAVGNARATLEAGFTTVRDLDGDPRGIRALRDAIERGDVIGPTIVNAGQMISVTGGHGDDANGLADQFAGAVQRQRISICDGADDCRRAVRQQVALGAAVIKIAATGGVLSNVSGGLGRAMQPEEMKAIVETAHSLGRKVAAHSHAAAGTKAALEAGVDTIEHGTFLDDETIRLLKRKGAWLVPTMMAQIVVEQARAGMLPASVIPKAEAAVASGRASHVKAIAAKVKIAFGTDSGVSKHGDNAGEFALMVAAGMTADHALQAATVSAADALGLSESIGTIESGKDADIIAIEGNPILDVKKMRHMKFVMRRGVVHSSTDLDIDIR